MPPGKATSRYASPHRLTLGPSFRLSSQTCVWTSRILSGRKSRSSSSYIFLSISLTSKAALQYLLCHKIYSQPEVRGGVYGRQPSDKAGSRPTIKIARIAHFVKRTLTESVKNTLQFRKFERPAVFVLFCKHVTPPWGFASSLDSARSNALDKILLQENEEDDHRDADQDDAGEGIAEL